MASQNVPGPRRAAGQRLRPRIGPIFVGTGLGSAVTALLGGRLINLAAITAALCAGPDAHPDPAKRYWSTVVGGLAYVALGLGAGFAAALVDGLAALLIQAVAGLALLGSFAGASPRALADERERLPATVTFVVAASGIVVSASARLLGPGRRAACCWRWSAGGRTLTAAAGFAASR